MVVTAHHIILDGFSNNLLLSELDMLYRGQALPPVQRQFTDFAVQERGNLENGQMAKELAFWKKVHQNTLDPLPLFPLEGVQPRKTLDRYSHDEAKVTLDSATTAKIRRGVRNNRATVFHFMLSALRVFLFRFLKVDELAIGVADANRHDVKTTTTIGFLLNILPLRFDSPERSEQFSSILAKTTDNVRRALDNSRLPFDALLQELNVPRSPSFNPLFQAFIDYKQFAGKHPPMLQAKAEGERFDGATGYDIVLDITDIPGSDMVVAIRAQKAIYPQHSEIMLKSFMQLVRSFANDFNSDATTVSLFSDSDRSKAVTLGRGKYHILPCVNVLASLCQLKVLICGNSRSFHCSQFD